jgi:hypothetical protein
MQNAPAWVKQNPKRFQPMVNQAGGPVWVLSSHCRANFEADRKAFCALLAHLKAKDEDKRRRLTQKTKTIYYLEQICYNGGIGGLFFKRGGDPWTN